MSLEVWVQRAVEQQASDLHLEPGLPMGLRVRGQLRMVGDPIPAATLSQAGRSLLSEEQWAIFRQRQSFDLSRTIHGVRCRINVLRTSRGVGMAVRLLTSFQATLKRLNLHPDLGRLVHHTHGLILVSGATGSGKSSTLAALIQEINLHETKHIVTLESPIEYTIAPRKSLVRQREVGRDTPSFEQALLDAMREDPDVLMVGELRDPETMRLTLNAAETGHLVLATVHSSTAAEALSRIVSAFAPEAQASVQAQLADALVAVVCQRLSFRTPNERLVPEVELLLATTAARATIRQGQFSKLQTVLESGGFEGQWTFARYRDWLAQRHDFYIPTERDADLAVDAVAVGAPPPPPPSTMTRTQPVAQRAAPVVSQPAGGVLEISADDDDPASILRQLEKRRF